MENIYWVGLIAILIHNLTLAYLSLFANTIQNYTGSEHIPLYLRIPGVINNLSSITYLVVTLYLFLSFRSTYFTAGTIVSLLAFLILFFLRKTKQGTVPVEGASTAKYQITSTDLAKYNLANFKSLLLMSLPYLVQLLLG